MYQKDIHFLTLNSLQHICVIVVQPRSMDPSKDLAAYGYGSVAWKERMELWKQKQDKMHQMRNDGGDGDDDGLDLPL
jgi:cellulose synthase A